MCLHRGLAICPLLQEPHRVSHGSAGCYLWDYYCLMVLKGLNVSPKKQAMENNQVLQEVPPPERGRSKRIRAARRGEQRQLKQWQPGTNIPGEANTAQRGFLRELWCLNQKENQRNLRREWAPLRPKLATFKISTEYILKPRAQIEIKEVLKYNSHSKSKL